MVHCSLLVLLVALIDQYQRQIEYPTHTTVHNIIDMVRRVTRLSKAVQKLITPPSLKLGFQNTKLMT